MSYFYIRTEWDFVLARVCYINKWEQTTRKCWETDKGSWHSLDYDELRDLHLTFKALIKMAKETERQWIIEANGLDFIRKILEWPSTEEKPEHKEIMSGAWDLLWELADDSFNHALIWSEFSSILMKHLRQKVYDNDACRHIVYRIYGISHIAQHEGFNILQILIRHFHKEKQNGPVREQGLTLFLQHFMMDERSISLMYQQLNDVYKKCFLHFIVDCFSRPLTDFIMDYRISSELLDCICNEFISKNELISLSSVPESSKVELLFSLFEAIAYAATDERHQLNKFNFPLMLNVVHLFHYVRTHDYMAELYFRMIQRNTKIPLKEIILSTIINLVKDNADHKEQAREAGLIKILVNYVSSERCGYLYKCMLYALIETCQTNPLNMALVEEIAKSSNWTGAVAVKDFLYDMNYKGEKIY